MISTRKLRELNNYGRVPIIAYNSNTVAYFMLAAGFFEGTNRKSRFAVFF